jgi:hypothetical protein
MVFILYILSLSSELIKYILVHLTYLNCTMNGYRYGIEDVKSWPSELVFKQWWSVTTCVTWFSDTGW